MTALVREAQCGLEMVVLVVHHDLEQVLMMDLLLSTTSSKVSCVQPVTEPASDSNANLLAKLVSVQRQQMKYK